MAQTLTLDKAELERLYIKEHRAAKEVAKELGCSKSSLFNWLTRYNLRRPRAHLNYYWLVSQYVILGKGTKEIARLCGWSQIVVQRAIKRFGLWAEAKGKQADLIRSRLSYQIWREKVFGRDNYTCQECNKRGGYLEPHHLKSVAHHPELALDVKNGITLCLPCHSKLDPYRGIVTEEI